VNEQAFVGKRDEDWRRLSEILDKADGKGLHTLTGDEVRECVRLYRRVNRDLAVARTKSRNAALIEYLNQLVGRAYGILYRSPRPDIWPAILNGIAVAAQTVRRRKWFVLASASVFFGSWLFVMFLLATVPDTRSALISPEMEPLFEQWKTGRHSDKSGSESAAMYGMYASNNPRVAIMAAAVGAATFGFGSLYLLYMNGALIGALAHEMATVGHLGFLLSSIAPHGVPELTGAIVAGGAGLLLGWALINPGRKRRGDALKAVGRDAVVLILTSVALMFIAAPIEAFFSFNPEVPQGLKVLVAIAGFLFWMAFWIGYGREKPDAQAS
jgi:uncharacterized membrane protein SpoIIM required for sporulation